MCWSVISLEEAEEDEKEKEKEGIVVETVVLL